MQKKFFHTQGPSRAPSRKETPLRRAVRSVLFGTAAAIVSCTLTLAICAFIVSIRDMPHTVIVLFSIACTMVGTLVGSFLSARLMRENGWLVGLAAGILFYLTVVLVNAGIGIAGTGLISLSRLVIILVTSLIGGMLGVNVRKKLRA